MRLSLGKKIFFGFLVIVLVTGAFILLSNSSLIRIQSLSTSIKSESNNSHQLNKLIFFVNQAEKTNKLALFSLIISSTLICLFMSRTITSKISKLNNITKKIAHGDFDSEIKFSANDEIGVLADNFRQMTTHIKQTTISKDYFDSIFDSMTDLLIVLSYDLKIKTINKSALELLGYLEDELLGRDVSLLLNTESGCFHPFEGDNLDRILTVGSLLAHETSLLSKSGLKIPVLISVAVQKEINCPNGNCDDSCPDFQKNGFHCQIVSGIVCVAKDISNRKKTEEDLKQAYSELQASLAVSESLRDDLLDEQDKRKEIQKSIEDKNAELISNEKALKNMLSDLNKAHKEMKANERSLNITLENLQSSNSQLKNAQGQLIQSEKLASIGQLAAGIAHEVNNPSGYIHSNLSTMSEYMTDIAGLLSLLDKLKCEITTNNLKSIVALKEQIDAFEKEIDLIFIMGDIGKLLRESQEGVNRIKEIVSDLKTFSRADGGVKDPTDINAMIDSVLHIVWNEIKYKIELKKEFGALEKIECSSQQVGQVVMNLIVNASQAVDEKGIVWLRTKDAGDFVHIEIEDNGSGIPKEIAQKIFEPFYTTKPVGEGTGLGLSISYDIIKKHGGEILLESEVGKGTKFIVTLPKISAGESC